MKNVIALLALCSGLFIIETTVFPYVSRLVFYAIHIPTLVDLRPNSALLFVIFLATQKGYMEGAILSVIIGYILDLFYLGTFGLYPFLYLTIFLLAKIIANRMQISGKNKHAIYVLILSLISPLLEAILLTLGGHYPGAAFFKLIIPIACINLLLAHPLFKLFTRVDLATRKTSLRKGPHLFPY